MVKPLNWDRVLKHIKPEQRTRVQRIIESNYADVVTTHYPVVEDENGVLRFKADPVIDFLWKRSLAKDDPFLNDMAVHFGNKRKKMASMKAFYRRLGYSLGGFAEVFCSWSVET